MLRSTILALGHPDPRLFICCLIYACLGLSQSKDFALCASRPERGGGIAGKKREPAKLGGSRRGTKGSKLLRLSKELLKRAATTRAALRKQPRCCSRAPVARRPRTAGARPENEHGQTVCDTPRLIQLQQVLSGMSPPTSRDLRADPGGRRLFRIPEELGLRQPRSSRRHQEGAVKKKRVFLRLGGSRRESADPNSRCEKQKLNPDYGQMRIASP